MVVVVVVLVSAAFFFFFFLHCGEPGIELLGVPIPLSLKDPFHDRHHGLTHTHTHTHTL